MGRARPKPKPGAGGNGSGRGDGNGSAPDPERPVASTEDFDELRRLLLGDAANRVDPLSVWRDNPKLHAEEIAKVLPHSIRMRAEQDEQVSQALAPSIEKTLHLSVKNEPEKMVDALSPVMMPAIRKSIVDTVREMIQSLNQSLEYGFSLRGLKWRLEAWKTGKSFAEVVMLRTLVYRVEQVFLIHRESGLLLHHVAAEQGVQDPDIVSAMLTAIQDFVRDSFGAGDEDRLNSFEVGKFTIWIVRGKHAMIAAVFSGRAPASLRGVLRDALARIHTQFQTEFETFDGDSALFQATEPELRSCCVVDQEKSKGGWLRTGVGFYVILLSVLFAGIVYLAYRTQVGMRFDDYVDELRGREGIVVIDSGRRDGRFFVEALRDPDAVEPVSILGDFDFTPEEVEFRLRLYRSLEPGMVEKRGEGE